ncbi:hypothetical protein Tco_0496618 [Tanacetum coccineum]
MVVLESCPKHNMVAYLEKTAGNTEFHEVINFLARSSIHNALAVSPVVSTTFVEQFWMSAKSKIINNVRYITAKVAGKPVSISEPSIRSDLLFDDADGIDSLPNQTIFDAIQLMGYEGDLTVLTFNKALHLDAKKKFVMYPMFISIFLDKHLMNVPVPLDHFPVNALTSKVFSFMVKKSKQFSGKVTPLFASMLVQPTKDEGATSERPSEPQLTPSLPHPSEANVEPQPDPSPRLLPSTHIPDSIPKSFGGNHGGQSSSDKSLSGNEGDMTLQSMYDLCISLCTQSLDKECFLEEKISKKEILEEKLDAKGVYVGRTRDVEYEEKKTVDDKVSTEDALSTDKEKVSTDRPNVSTDRPKVSTDKEKDSTVSPDEGTDDQTEGRSATPTTPTTTPTIFGDDETIAQVLLNMTQARAVSRENEKGVELKDVEETERPRPTSTRSLLTLKPLPKIDPKDKGKKKIEEENESDTESEGIPEAEKKFKQLAIDEEIARKFTVEERAKFLHDTIAAQRRFLAEQRAIAIRNEPPTRTQLRNQIMTYLKHVGNKKHSDLKSKTFEDIQALYEESERLDECFHCVGRTSTVPVKVEVTEQGTKKRKGGHLKMISRKRKRTQPDVNNDDEHRKCLKIVTFEGIQRFIGACGVYILELKDGTVIHMLVEKRYLFDGFIVVKMLILDWRVERESTATIDLIRLIKQRIVLELMMEIEMDGLECG